MRLRFIYPQPIARDRVQASVPLSLPTYFKTLEECRYLALE
ncbi:hypothetical protein OGM63_03375 [Plectonema radiosum NIES-515]|uniref:Uncharacterized protein n=1 Tax=Plectonema radiosum NIES-515 TaxID=2986073 RepID=A0ABT3AV29_9CYAN|nr:hypothetical protein [Plectonema radiosum]MCV3212580.1 hypothetical protein [Plectonema radiosum NIES-515]